MSGVALAIGAGVAAAGLGVSIYQGQAQKSNAKNSLDAQKSAQNDAANRARSQQRSSEEAQNMANRKEPDIASIMEKASKQGVASTMLTGARGSPSAGALGKTTMLGS
jgi:uncharacterized protein HemX